MDRGRAVSRGGRPKAGHYESFYIKACRPGGGQGIWIRHTVHKRPGRRAQRLDLVRPLRPRRRGAAGDQGDGAGGASSRRRPAPGSGSPTPRSARAGPSGSVDDRRPARPSWDLTFSGDAEPCKYLPADWLYEAPVPRTKFVAPYPDARFDGRLEIDGDDDRARRLAGDDRPQLGHRARRALGLARGHRLRRTRPAPTSTPAPPGSSSAPGRPPGSPRGCWCSTARRTGSAASAQIRSASIEESPAACAFVLPGKDIVVRGRVSRPAEGLRRLGLRRPQGPRAQHGQLLGRRPRADRRTPGLPARELTLARRRRLRVRDARDRPRHPDPALPGRLSGTRRAPLSTGVARWTDLLEGHPAVVGAERAPRAGRRGSW